MLMQGNDASLVAFVDNLQQFHRLVRVDTGDGLVAKEYTALLIQSSTNGNTLPLASRELADWTFHQALESKQLTQSRDVLPRSRQRT